MEEFLQVSGALYDETRVKLLKFLLIHGPSCVCELQDSFGMIQSRLSRHLKILKDAGFLKSEKIGRWTYYSLKEEMDGWHQCALEAIGELPIDLPRMSKECRR